MDWMIYGANGYTGDLIAREAKKQGANPVLAGRAVTKIAKLARDLSLPSKVFLSIREALRPLFALLGKLVGHRSTKGMPADCDRLASLVLRHAVQGTKFKSEAWVGNLRLSNA